MTKSIIHITHSDPFKDTRILNIVESIEEIDPKNRQYIIGLNQKKNIIKKFKSKKIISLKIYSRFLPYSLGLLRFLFVVIEFNLRVFFFTLKIKPNLIHCHDLVGLYIGLIFKKFFSATFIFDAHELEAQANFVTPIGHVIRTVYEFLPVLYCDHLITVSDSIGLWYRLKGASRISIIFNKPNFNEPKTYRDTTLLEKLPPKFKGINLLYVGALEEGRSIKELINLFKGIDGYNLYFLGEGSLKNNIKKNANFYENIFLHDFVDKDKIVDFIKGFDYSFCLIESCSLSDYFSMPNKLFQSLASGIPVIATNIPDISKFVYKYNCGFVINNIKELLPSLDTYSKKIDHFKILIKKNKNEFFWKSEYHKIKNIYK